jgi:hypothetical protein
MTTPPRRQHAFCFVDGTLTVLGDGYHGKGDGWFTFDEDVIEWQPHDEKSGSYLVAKIPRSELIALRDFLNGHFPPEAHRA